MENDRPTRPTLPTPSAQQLSKLLLMQSVLESLPNEQSICSFVARGLADLPGVASAHFSDQPGELPAEPGEHRFPLNVGHTCKGELRLTCDDPAAFQPYEEHLKNFCFMVAVILEERHQRHRRETQQATLEKQVAERTRELENQVAERSRAEQQVRALLAEAERSQRALLGILEDQKLADEALRESKQQLAVAMDQAQLAHWELDAATGILTLNDRLYTLYGTTADQEGGYRMAAEVYARKFLPEEEQHLVAGTIAQMRASRALEFQLEHRIRRRDGELRHLLVRITVVRDDDGQISSTRGSSQDITERKRAETALRESETRYRQLFEMESDAVLLADCETHQFVDVNLSAQRLYGYTKREFLELRAEDISNEPAKTSQTVSQPEANIPLRWHRKKNGEVFPVEISANIIEHQGGRCQLAAIRDITVRQHVMDMLRETTRQFLEAQQVAGLGSYAFDPRTGTWTCSSVLDGLFGLDDPAFEKDVQGWLQIIHPEERLAMQDYLQDDILTQHKSFDREYRILRVADQQERWVHGLGKLELDEQGQVVRMIGTIQDITDRKRSEEQMFLQFSALTAAANSIAITDRSGTIKWVNPSFTKLTGYAEEEAIGKNLRILKSGKQSHKFYGELWAAIKAGKVWHGELINRRKDGSDYYEDMTITPVKGMDGQIAHFVAIKQDVTERHQLDARLRQAQKMEAIGTLAGGIAHDFNNILAAMFGYTYLLEQDVADNAAARENVAEILRAATRAKDLVQQILTFSRQREQKRQTIHLETVIKEVLKFLRASMPASLQLELRLAADTPAVLADPTQVYQVVMNLATNAQHAMGGQAGQLTVTLEPFAADTEFVRAHPGLRVGNYARLNISDTGCGMDARTLERIFEPFFTTKPVGEGTGLGLAVVHGIMQSHEGAISVDSRVGAGTTFRLYFPAQTAENTEHDTTLLRQPTGHGQHILLVDDEKALTTMFERLLKRLNYQVTSCNGGREALECFRAEPQKFALVVTDLTMPDLNGLGVARQISTLRPGIPIILISGFSATTPEEQIRAAGVREVLTKPLSLSTLAEAVHRAINATPMPPP